MALIDFTGFENWNRDHTLANWAYGSFTRSTSGPKTGSLCGYQYDHTQGHLSGFRRDLAGAEQHATLYVGCWMKFGGSSYFKTLYQFLGDTAATIHVTFTLESVGTITARLGSYNGTSLASAAVPAFAVDEWRHYEFKVVLSDTVGVVACRVDGMEIFNETGLDTKNGGTADVFDAVRGPSTVATDNEIYVDDLFIANGDAGASPSSWVGGARVYPMRPAAAGSSTGFTASTGSNYTCVDEADFTAGTDYVYAVADDLRDLYAMGDVTFETGSTPLAVKMSAIAVNSSTGDRTLSLSVRSGGTTDVGSAAVLATASKVYERLMVTNPVTNAEWSAAEVDGLEAGFDSGS